MKQIFIQLAKGFWIGGTLTVPGVSGGAMAMLLNIYDRLITSLNGLFRRGDRKEKKAHLAFLATVGVGGIAGAWLFSRLVSHLLSAFPVHMCFLFAGAVAGGIPAVLSAAGVKKIGGRDLFLVLGGILVVLSVSLIPEGLFDPQRGGGLWWVVIQLIGGFVVAFGLVLPGISMSQMLYVFGIYASIIDCVAALNIFPLIPFAVGGVAGTLATSFGVEKLMTRFPRETYLVIFGFLLGSIPQIFSDVSLLGYSPVTWGLFTLLFLVGAALMATVFLLEHKGGSKK